MPATRPIPIPRIVSSPIDPQAPSLLTTLPPEIRNTVYELFFHRGKPVLLHDGKGYRERLLRKLVGLPDPDWDSGSSASGAGDEEEEVDFEQLAREINLELHTKDDKFRHGFATCATLLRTCRQVYHEAAGVLYGSNSFEFPGFWENCGRAYQNHHYQYASRWLSDIGSHFSLLSKISINMNVVGPPYWHGPPYTKRLDLLPFLKLIWANPDARCEIGFTQPNQTPEAARLSGNDTEQTQVRVTALILNNLLATIGKADVLAIKRYASFPRILSAVDIDTRNGLLEACVLHLTRHAAVRCGPYTKRFSILDDGKTVQLVQCDASRSHILQLPKAIQRIIYNYACTSDTDVIFDLDLDIAFGLPMNVLHLCRQIRANVMLPERWIGNRVTIELNSEFLSTNFDKFTSLQRWVNVRTFFDLFNSNSRGNAAEIALIFRNMENATLEDCRIDIKMLLLPFQRYSGTFRIKFTRTTAGGSLGDCGEVARVKWGTLRCAVFLLLSDILKDMPYKAQGPLPQIWIDGRGQLLGARFRGRAGAPDQLLEFRYTSLDDDQAHDLAHQKILNFVRAANAGQVVPNCTRLPSRALSFSPDWNRRLIAADSLAETWETLRDTLWPD